MKCPSCGKELERMKRQVSTTESEIRSSTNMQSAVTVRSSGISTGSVPGK